MSLKFNGLNIDRPIGKINSKFISISNHLYRIFIDMRKTALKNNCIRSHLKDGRRQEN